MVRGEIGDEKRLNFLIDTGAQPTVIDARFARRLHLEGSAQTLSLFNQEFQSRQTVLPEIRLGPVRAKSVRVLVNDLSFIEAGLGVRIDALVGLDVLGGQSFSIDYESQRIEFGPVAESGAAVEFEPGLDYIVVQMHAGNSMLRLLVDTGTNHLIFFEERGRGRVGALPRLGTKSLSNLAGAITLDQLELRDARLGESVLPPQLALMLKAPAGGHEGLDGLLGVTTLGAKRVDFDFKRRTMRWAR